MGTGLLILRLVVGLTMAAHGSQKLLGWFGGGGIGGTAQMMEKLGFRAGRFHAGMAGAGEVGGGLLLALGLLTPLGAALILAVMIVAFGTVSAQHGFFAQNGGFEYNLVLGAAALSLAFTGPGAYSLDHVAGLRSGGAAAGLWALFGGLAAGGLELMLRTAGRAPRTATQ